MKQRTKWDDDLLVTDLKWNPRVISYARGGKRGALIGTLLGLPVDGRTCGRGTAYQFQMLTGEIHTVWWDGTMYGEAPYFLDVDTGERVLRNPAGIAWFARFDENGKLFPEPE
jgi:hypothetical protein